MFERIFTMVVIIMFEKLLNFLLNDVKVSKKALQDLVEKADYDLDGFITLGEFVNFVRGVIGKSKK